MQISEVMSTDVITVQANHPIRKVAQLMRDNDIGAVPVYEGSNPKGFVTDRDIVLACADENVTLEDQISTAMTPNLVTIDANQEVTEAARIMEEKQISRLLVVDGTKAIGIVSLSDLLGSLENTHLKAEIVEEIKQ